MNYAIMLSGGMGTRLGYDIPKQYIKVADRMIITYSLETIIASEYIDSIVVVTENEWIEDILYDLNKHNISKNKIKGFASPGANRQLSILSGMNKIVESRSAIDNDHDSVLIHDAARPFLSHELLKKCYIALEGHDGVMPVLPMKDTVYYSEDGRMVSSLIDRSKVYAGQAPELFLLDKYYAANECLLPDRILGINGSSEPAVLSGMDIAMVPGDENNLKITTITDLERFYECLGITRCK